MNSNGPFIGIPPPQASEVWIDFDGTLTQVDVIDSLICRFAVNDNWRTLETDWQAGRIGSRECLAGQFDLVRILDDELDALLASVSLDPGASRLLALLGELKVRVTVLSEGIDWFIQRIFSTRGLEPPVVRSNTVVRDGASLRFECPFSSPDCSTVAGHCKCASMQTLETPMAARIYIGDGRSDLCAARKAHVRFAKGVLAARLEEERLAFIRFTTLHDVAQILASNWFMPRTAAA